MGIAGQTLHPGLYLSFKKSVWYEKYLKKLPSPVYVSQPVRYISTVQHYEHSSSKTWNSTEDKNCLQH